MSTPFSQAERAAREALHSGSVTLSEWASAADACARALAYHRLENEAVSRAAMLGPVVATPSPETVEDSSLVQAFLSARSVALDDADRESASKQAGRALLFVTHAATWDAGDVGQVLLGAIERDLIGDAHSSKRAAPFEVSLSRWRAALGREAAHPTSANMAVAIAHNQRGVLALGLDLLNRVDENPAMPGSLDRLRRNIEASRDAWVDAAQLWRTSLGRAGGDADRGHVAHLSLAVQEVRSAMRMQVSPEEQLDALLATGFGGNVVATVLTAGEDPRHAGALVGAAQSLDQAVDSLLGQPAGPSFVGRDTLHPSLQCATPERLAPSPQQTAPPPARTVDEPLATPGSGVQSEKLILTREIENELAKRRDVGVWAQAVLDGDPIAQSFGAHIPTSDLGRLATGGREAQATLVASVSGLIWKANRKVYGDVQNDGFQDGAVDVAAAAAKWDPGRSRWLTYAKYVADWANAHSARTSYKRPIPAELDELPARLVNAKESNTEAEALDPLMQQVAVKQVERLPPELKMIVSARLGLDGEKRTQADIGQELGISPSSVIRRYELAIAMLRRNLDGPEQSTPATPRASVKDVHDRIEALKHPGGKEPPLQRVQRLLGTLETRSSVAREPSGPPPPKAPDIAREL